MKEKTTHFMSTVKVGPKGQVVIPKEIRQMFDIESGDNLIIMADIKRGIAIQKHDVMEKIANVIYEGGGNSIFPDEKADNLTNLANAIKETEEKGASQK